MLGLHKLFTKEFRLDHSRLKKEFDEEYDTYLKIKGWFKGRQIEKKRLTIYSPGVGKDIASLFMIYDAAVSKANKHADLIFVEMRDMYEELLHQIGLFTSGAAIIRRGGDKEKYLADVYYKDRSFRIVYYLRDISDSFPRELKHSIDIYYERAFQMFRDKNFMFSSLVSQNMNPYGLVMTDYGFDFGSYDKDFKRISGIPSNFGLYKKFQVWQRKPFTRK